ncbi:hypothetical protein PAPYR_475 [Paratrimastix pyriformis]|uniref:Uncharacterized protein n=1 Tax=Paratrimastix pyriformis TaxID=342808 RepID=A0ABQ8UTP3_9EUKA|nr:hypothetical protein PAPYR_475 [Paratrimastix pyriformis]
MCARDPGERPTMQALWEALNPTGAPDKDDGDDDGGGDGDDGELRGDGTTTVVYLNEESFGRPDVLDLDL